MSAIPAKTKAAPAATTLRRLFLTVFLRGHTSRGLSKETVPRSVGQKLALTLLLYAALSLVALIFIGRPVFALSAYLHAMTFLFLGMFVTVSAGEMLFNKEESDVLMHRPVTSKDLLWAKIGVLTQVSLWIAGAANLAGFFVGVGAEDGGWLFPIVHALSTGVEALLCTGCVVLTYQLCLRWFGRERLENLMTTMQVLVMVAMTVGSQLMSREVATLQAIASADLKVWWMFLVPPAWFAGLDDAVAGSHAPSSAAMGAIGILATGLVLWFAFTKLAESYQTGLQAMSEAPAPRPERPRRLEWLNRLAAGGLVRRALKSPVERAGFILTIAYLLRDRDVKLRVYPGIAPIFAMPAIIMLNGHGGKGLAEFAAFGICFAGVFVALTPTLILDLLSYTQQWRAAEVFQIAPTRGPWALQRGAQLAVIAFPCLPMLAIFGVYVGIAQGPKNLLLLLPGVLSMPPYALMPALVGGAVPLSKPNEEAKSAGRSLKMMGAMLMAFVLAGFGSLAWYTGWFTYFLLAEAAMIALACWFADSVLRQVRWKPLD
ncbi:MAG: hypothetical protein HYR64_05960 [Fimbriimonas ginsengisoli]|uniref:Uncharacterized protein n=1 Tax=Fimbriimonas ginsengisoli TaxID=1005039 RepID=A0A931LSG6_FIMGI|nr:hypothetical protein [Fimbriimonas ginsengisoli]